jgi:hypothetical protein
MIVTLANDCNGTRPFYVDTEKRVAWAEKVRRTMHGNTVYRARVTNAALLERLLKRADHAAKK